MNKFNYLPTGHPKRRYGIKRPKQKNWKISLNRKEQKLIRYINKYDTGISSLKKAAATLIILMVLLVIMVLKSRMQ